MSKAKKLYGIIPDSEEITQETESEQERLIRKLFLSMALNCLINYTKPINYNPDTYFNDAGTTWDLIGGVYLMYMKPANLEVSKCAAHFYEWKNEIFSYFNNEEIQDLFFRKMDLEEIRLVIQNKLNNE